MILYLLSAPTSYLYLSLRHSFPLPSRNHKGDINYEVLMSKHPLFQLYQVITVDDMAKDTKAGLGRLMKGQLPQYY